MLHHASRPRNRQQELSARPQLLSRIAPPARQVNVGVVTQINIAFSLYFICLALLGLSLRTVETVAISITFTVLMLAGMGLAAFKGSAAQSIASGRTAVLFAATWFLVIDGIDLGSDAYVLLPGEVILGLSWVCVFLGVFFAVYAMPLRGSAWRIVLEKTNVSISPLLLGWTAVFCSVICFSAILWRYNFNLEMIYTVYTGGRMYGSGGLFKRGYLGGQEVLYQILGYVSHAIPAIAMLCWYPDKFGRRCPLPLLWISSSFAIFIVLVVLAEGSRGNMLAYLAPAVVIWYVKNSGKKSLKTMIGVGSLAILIIPVMQLQYAIRFHVADEGSAAIKRGLEGLSINPLAAHRDNNLYLLSLVVKHMPEDVPYEGFDSIFYLLVNPIPRFIWANKPVGIVGDINTPRGAYAMGPLTQGTANLTSSIVGSGFKSLGLMGVVMWAVVYGFLVRSFEIWITPENLKNSSFLCLFGLVLYWFTMGFREDFMFITFFYPVAGAIIVLVGVKFLKRLGFI